MRKVASWVVVLTLGVATALAQQTAAKKSFEVASIKQSAPLDPQKVCPGSSASA